MVLALAEQSGVHLALSLQAGLFSNLGWVRIFVFLVNWLINLVFVLCWHAAIFADTEFLTSTLWQG